MDVGFLRLQYGSAPLHLDLFRDRSYLQLQILLVDLADDHRNVRLLERPETCGRNVHGIRALGKVQNSVTARGVRDRLTFQTCTVT